MRLCDANHTKIEALDSLATEFRRLCQQYSTSFCSEAQPDKYSEPCFESPLSQRWQRVGIQHAAGIAQSWRAKYAAAYQDYLRHAGRIPGAAGRRARRPPEWKEWTTPVLKETVIEANANVALLQPSEDSSFDYWLRLSTLERGQPILLPVKLSAYHQQALMGKTLNTSTTLTRKPAGWWLTLSYDEQV